MKTHFFILFIALLGIENSWANRVVNYKGVAKDGDKVVYIEKHRVEYDNQDRLISAKTIYENVDGKPIAELNSDFRKSLTVPDHRVEDFRTGEVQGLRRSENKLVLFDQEKGKEEKTKVFDESDAEDRVLVGCQGLNYYLLTNLDSLAPEKMLPLRFIIPGKLDYYDFDMTEVSDPKATVAEFEIKIKNWLLKLFAPKLHVRYDKKLKRIVWYQGISNIKSENGGNQKVTIEYEYEKGT